MGCKWRTVLGNIPLKHDIAESSIPRRPVKFTLITNCKDHHQLATGITAWKAGGHFTFPSMPLLSLADRMALVGREISMTFYQSGVSAPRDQRAVAPVDARPWCRSQLLQYPPYQASWNSTSATFKTSQKSAKASTQITSPNSPDTHQVRLAWALTDLLINLDAGRPSAFRSWPRSNL